MNQLNRSLGSSKPSRTLFHYFQPSTKTTNGQIDPTENCSQSVNEPCLENQPKRRKIETLDDEDERISYTENEENCSFLVNQETSDENSTSNNQVKISTRLFKPKKSGAKKIPNISDDESVDVDFLSDSLLAKKEKDILSESKKDLKEDNKMKISPQLFKEKPKRKRPPKSSSNVNYDSDSIDVDVLSTIADKNFTNDDNKFNMLLEEPLTANYKILNSQKSPEVIKNNAFSILMSKSKKTKFCDEDISQKKNNDTVVEKETKEVASLNIETKTQSVEVDLIKEPVQVEPTKVKTIKSISKPPIPSYHIRQADSNPLWNIKRPKLVERLSNNKNIEYSLGPLYGVSLKAEIINQITREVVRLDRFQIYHFLKSLQMIDCSFPVSKIFCGYVEKKLEWDSIVEDARKNNMNLEDLEERITRGFKSRKSLSKSQTKQKQNSNKKTINYDSLRKCSLQWTMKYMPQSTDDLIGNKNVVKELIAWLEEWKESRESSINASKKSNFSSDDSDLDEDGSPSNTILLSGPNGTGKTSAVYGIANDMGFNVLEVNASSCRSGKRVLGHLHEATQSHTVNKQDSNRKSNSFLRKSTSLSKMVLILFEDIDVVFDNQDDGFYTALNSIISTTKRPIILTTSNPNFYVKKYFKFDIRCLNFDFPTVSSVSSHLQLLCLSEGFALDKKSIEILLDQNCGSIAKTILDLQYWTLSGDSKQSTDDEEMFIDDETDIFNDSNNENENDSIISILSIKKSKKKKPFRVVKPKKSHSLNEFSNFLQTFDNAFQENKVWPEGVGVILNNQNPDFEGNSKKMIHKLSDFSDISSQFLPFSDNLNWTGEKRYTKENKLHRLNNEIIAYIQNKDILDASDSLSDLISSKFSEHKKITKRKKVKHEENKELINRDISLLIGSTNNKVDSLATLRSISRLDELKKNSSEMKKFRSRRYLSYLEMQEIYLTPKTLKLLRTTFN